MIEQQDWRDNAIEICKHLLCFPSITPQDHGCQDWIIQYLEPLGFQCHKYVDQGVSNLIAIYGQQRPVIGFAGHTDVVPPGDIDQWINPPFSAVIEDGRLYGRGTADMKGGIAAWLASVKQLIDQDSITGSLVILLTSDEEGEAEYGTKVIVEHLQNLDITLDYCIVGEPTAKTRSGDTIRIGRRGAISVEATFEGIQGHVAYPNYADNALHKATKAAVKLQAIEWDQGSEHFPGTTLQITHIQSGEYVDNTVPGQATLCFNVRFSHRTNLDQVKQTIISRIDDPADYQWLRLCENYYTEPRKQNCLIQAGQSAIKQVCGIETTLSTSGGSSDGRFIANDKTQVIELGLCNKAIHQINESVELADLTQLCDIYHQLIKTLSSQ
jgi:succinyl-diaminopimelate desuccinylase